MCSYKFWILITAIYSIPLILFLILNDIISLVGLNAPHLLQYNLAKFNHSSFYASSSEDLYDEINTYNELPKLGEPEALHRIAYENQFLRNLNEDNNLDEITFATNKFYEDSTTNPSDPLSDDNEIKDDNQTNNDKKVKKEPNPVANTISDREKSDQIYDVLKDKGANNDNDNKTGMLEKYKNEIPTNAPGEDKKNAPNNKKNLPSNGKTKLPADKNLENDKQRIPSEDKKNALYKARQPDDDKTKILKKDQNQDVGKDKDKNQEVDKNKNKDKDQNEDMVKDKDNKAPNKPESVREESRSDLLRRAWNEFLNGLYLNDHKLLLNIFIFIKIGFRVLSLITLPLLIIGNHTSRSSYIKPFKMILLLQFLFSIGITIYFGIVSTECNYYKNIKEWISKHFEDPDAATGLNVSKLYLLITFADLFPYFCIISLILISKRDKQIAVKKEELQESETWNMQLRPLGLPRIKNTANRENISPLNLHFNQPLSNDELPLTAGLITNEEISINNRPFSYTNNQSPSQSLPCYDNHAYENQAFNKN